MLENNITLKINSIIYEDTEILNELFYCGNMSLLDIHVDYSSLLKFQRFYRIPKSTYLFELTNITPSEELQSSLQKLNQWLIYSSNMSQNPTDLQFLDCHRLLVTINSNGTQQQEMKAQIVKYMLKKQVDLFNQTTIAQYQENDIEEETEVKKFKIRYLNLRDILQITQESHLESFFKQVVSSIKQEEGLLTNQQTILILDSCEYFMEQDKYNENITKFKLFTELISNLKVILILTQHDKKQYYNLSEKITSVKF